MPHHPSARCEVEKAIARSDIAVKDVFFFMLDESAQRRMNDAFGLSGCA